MSRIESISKEFRDEQLLKNSCRYVCGKEYKEGSPDTISDGDCRGREPMGNNGSVGTNFDIACRKTLIGLNSTRYTPGHEYGECNA